MGTKVTAFALQNAMGAYNFNASDYHLSGGMYYIVLENSTTKLNAKVLLLK